MKSFWSSFKYKINEAVQETTAKRWCKRKAPDDPKAEVELEQNQEQADKGEYFLTSVFTKLSRNNVKDRRAGNKRNTIH